MTTAAAITYPTILIVEDHEQMRTALRELLALVFKGCALLEASSGESALAIAFNLALDLVMMDVSLPMMSGIEATRQIKRICPKTQVVMLTIHEEPCYQEEAMAAGASAYVFKRKIGADLIPTLATLLHSGEVHIASRRAEGFIRKCN